MRAIPFLIFILGLSFQLSGQTGELNLTGVYKGQGLYVRNSYDIDSQRFCVKKILINGKKSSVNLNLTAIHLPFGGVELYSPVSIKILLEDSLCKAKIVNPDAILYHSAFKFDSLVLNDSIMHWYTKGDKSSGRFKVQKLSGDQWFDVKEIRAKGRFEGARYVYFPEHDDGGNKYRVKYELSNGRYLYSSEVEHYHYPESITFSPRVVTHEINLSRATTYEIMDSDGEVILRGTGKKIPLRRLKPGDYSILLEGEVDTFMKK